MLPETRIAQIIEVEEPQGLRNRAWILTLDFGELGIKKSVGQFRNLTRQELLDRLVVCVIGLGIKKVGNYTSDCLVLGTPVSANPNDGHQPLQPHSSAFKGQPVA